MGFSDLLKLFSLSVLDLRLEPPSDDKKRQHIISKAGQVRWKTREFYIYGIIFAVCVPLMCKSAIDASRCKCIREYCQKLIILTFFFLADNINYPKYSNRLSDGWLFGRKVVCNLQRLL